MGRRALAWFLVTPVAAAGVLAMHTLAYRLTGVQPGPMHDYLAHVPQVLFVLVSLALVGLAVQERSLSRVSPRWVAPLAPLGFVCQECLERLVHGGHVPFLFTSPTFLVGLVLQLPVACLCVLVVRRVTGTLTDVHRRRPARVGVVRLVLEEPPTLAPRSQRRSRAIGRGPPTSVAA